MTDQVDSLVYAMRALASQGTCRGCGIELDMLTSEADGLCRGEHLPIDTARRCFMEFSTHAFRAKKMLAFRKYRLGQPTLPWTFEEYGIDWTPEMLVLLDSWLETKR